MLFRRYKSNQPERHLLIFTQRYGLHLSITTAANGTIAQNQVNPDVHYKYTGQEYEGDIAANLHNYRARFYDSDLGRFYAMDPAGQSLSPYSYARNNPLSYTDPTGMVDIYYAERLKRAQELAEEEAQQHAEWAAARARNDIFAEEVMRGRRSHVTITTTWLDNDFVNVREFGSPINMGTWYVIERTVTFEFDGHTYTTIGSRTAASAAALEYAEFVSNRPESPLLAFGGPITNATQNNGSWYKLIWDKGMEAFGFAEKVKSNAGNLLDKADANIELLKGLEKDQNYLKNARDEAITKLGLAGYDATDLKIKFDLIDRLYETMKLDAHGIKTSVGSSSEIQRLQRDLIREFQLRGYGR